MNKVAIIGAGIAGLSCATYLQNNGLQVTIFEKSHGPSGRISTRTGSHDHALQSLPWQCDHGAQYFTARDANFYAEVIGWQQAGVAAIWSPKLQTTDGIQFIDKADTVQRFVGVGTNTAPAKFLAQSLHLQVKTTIDQIEQQQNSWRLCSIENGWHSDNFDAVLFAIPAPQVAPVLGLYAPTLKKIAESVTMLGCWALMCRFTEPLHLPFDGLFVNNGILSWVARDSAKPGRAHYPQETWVLHASAAWSEAHIEDDADAVAAKMIAAFVALGGSAPQAYTAHRWRYAQCAEHLECGFAYDNDSNIGLCGDWINAGKVQGAWLSGMLLAQKIITQF